MLNLIKWDFMNYIKKYCWLYAGYAIAFAIACLFPRTSKGATFLVIGICASFSVFYYLYTIIISVVQSIDWLKKESIQLELSLPKKPWMILLSKLIISIAANVTGLISAQLLWKAVGEFGFSNIVLYNGFTGFCQYTAAMVIIIVAFMLSYLLVRSLGLTQVSADISATFFTFVICAALFLLVSTIFSFTGLWNVSFTTSMDGVYANIKAVHELPAAIGGAIGVLTIVFSGFYASSKLLKSKFEIVHK